jgi:syndecan 4
VKESGIVVCRDGFRGVLCAEKGCLNDCSNNGRCKDGVCVCRLGYTGPDCSVKDCPSACSNAGVCIKGSCDCEKGYRGIACEEKFVINGKIIEGARICEKGW